MRGTGRVQSAQWSSAPSLAAGSHPAHRGPPPPLAALARADTQLLAYRARAGAGKFGDVVLAILSASQLAILPLSPSCSPPADFTRRQISSSPLNPCPFARSYRFASPSRTSPTRSNRLCPPASAAGAVPVAAARHSRPAPPHRGLWTGSSGAAPAPSLAVLGYW